MKSALLLFGLLALSGAAAFVAQSAQATPPLNATSPMPRALSQYELDSLETGLARLDAQVEPVPEGKRVEKVEVVVLDVFEPRDPAPGLLNWFHVNTQETVVRREVLLGPGQSYSSLLAAESERNLRKFVQYSVVLVTPVKGSTPDSVRILVVVKDVWSLRLSWDPSFDRDTVTALLLSPSELNLFGTTQSASGTINAGPNNLWLGLNYYVPRVGGSRISATVSGNAQLNCRTGDLEGGSGLLSYGKPLYSTRTAWSWGVNASYTNQVIRGALGTASTICSSPGPAGVRVALDPNAHGITSVAYIPNIYRSEVLTSTLGMTRSFFVRDKVNLSFGLEARRDRNTPLGEPTEMYAGTWAFNQSDPNETCWPPTKECAGSPALSVAPTTEFDSKRLTFLYNQQRLPVSGFRIGPYLQLQTFETRFLRMLNVNTLGLQEDVQLGRNVTWRTYVGVRPLASRNLVGTIAKADYTFPLRGGVFQLGGSSTLETSGLDDDFARVGIRRSSRSEVRVEVHSHLVTPDFGFGRIVMGTSYGDHPQWRYAPAHFQLGSMGRLRGYPPIAMHGRTVLVNNLELRTAPVELFSAQLGMVAFWDAGSTASGPENLALVHGVGAGLRVLLPQIDRQVFRIDVGFPWQGDALDKFTVTAGFRQAFGDN